MTKPKFNIPYLGLHSTLILAFTTSITATPVAANSNFGKIELSPGFTREKGRVTGYTKGSFPLHTMGKRDRQGNPCIGFAAPTPDHILILEKDFPRLQLQVDSGDDTTLFIQGPNDSTIRCGDDTGRDKDASIVDNAWKAGSYRIWIGTFKQNVQSNYSLYIKE
ncbi:MAG: hypothetical protein HRU34_12975 [Richelia sp.]|nr:hypothetical protein [Richelia sp.]CDN12634.1 hypothetical protein RintRC_5273 [Richelia intracellularis]